MSADATGDIGFLATIWRVLRQPRAFFAEPHPFRSKVPAVLVCAIANGLTAAGSAALLGVLPWPNSARAFVYLVGAVLGAFVAGAAVSVPMLYLGAGVLHGFARVLRVPSQLAATRDISGYATVPMFLNVIPVFMLITMPWNWLLTASAMRSHYRTGRWRWVGAVVAIDLLIYACMPLIPQAFFDVEVVPTASMLPTIGPEQKVVISKYSYLLTEPKRGDIIAYETTGKQGHVETHVSRVVGLPGESIGLRGPQLSIDDKPVPICPVKDPRWPQVGKLTDALELFIEDLPGRRHWIGREHTRQNRHDADLVGKAEVMVAGDARDQSGARRTSVQLSRIKGKVWFTLPSSGLRLQRINDEPRLSEFSPPDALALSSCLDANSPEESVTEPRPTAKRMEPLAAAQAPPPPEPKPKPAPADLLPEELAKRLNDFTPSPSSSIVVLHPLPKPERPEGITPMPLESVARYELFLVDAHRLLRITNQETTPLGTDRWVAPTAMARLDDELFIVDDGYLWSVTSKGTRTRLGSRPWPVDSLLTSYAGSLFGYHDRRFVVVSTTHGAIQTLADSTFPQVRALSHADGHLIVDDKGLVAISALGEPRQRTPGQWSGKTLMAPWINGALLLHSNALWLHNAYMNDLERYGSESFNDARGLAVSNRHVFVAYKTKLVEVTNHGASVHTVATLRNFQTILP